MKLSGRVECEGWEEERYRFIDTAVVGWFILKTDIKSIELGFGVVYIAEHKGISRKMWVLLRLLEF
jgi:hypothetical protein